MQYNTVASRRRAFYKFLQLSVPCHLDHDVQPANKLAADDELREGRPLVDLL